MVYGSITVWRLYMYSRWDANGISKTVYERDLLLDRSVACTWYGRAMQRHWKFRFHITPSVVNAMFQMTSVRTMSVMKLCACTTVRHIDRSMPLNCKYFENNEFTRSHLFSKNGAPNVWKMTKQHEHQFFTICYFRWIAYERLKLWRQVPVLLFNT